MGSRASVQEALGWLATETGRKPAENRAELLENLNDVRRLFYNLYEHARLNFYIEACLPVQKFKVPCFGDCPDGYAYGVTLPVEAEQAEGLWKNSSPVPIYNQWYEYKSYIHDHVSGSLKGIDLGSDFPSQGDLLECAYIKFSCIDPSDEGKIVSVTYTNANGERVEGEQIQLAQDGFSTKEEASSLFRPGGIVLPTGLKGGVIVQDGKSGKQIGILHPKQIVPGFRRLKLTGVCCDDQVYVKATRKFFPVEFDWEVIETDNKLAILDAHRYLKIMSVNSSDAQWLAKANSHMKNVVMYLGADSYRSDGSSSVRQLRIMPFKRQRSRLIKRQY